VKTVGTGKLAMTVVGNCREQSEGGKARGIEILTEGTLNQKVQRQGGGGKAPSNKVYVKLSKEGKGQDDGRDWVELQGKKRTRYRGGGGE